MEQNETKQGQKNGHRRWAGESLWGRQSAGSRSVEVAASDGGRFKAIGRVGSKLAFETSLHRDQLRRFRRQMERAGAVLQGMPDCTEPGPNGKPPPKSGGRGPIGTDGTADPPPNPNQPKKVIPAG